MSSAKVRRSKLDECCQMSRKMYERAVMRTPLVCRRGREID